LERALREYLRKESTAQPRPSCGRNHKEIHYFKKLNVSSTGSESVIK
jgi:hypothetical protein